jgi:hypothetical protein
MSQVLIYSTIGLPPKSLIFHPENGVFNKRIHMQYTASGTAFPTLQGVLEKPEEVRRNSAWHPYGKNQRAMLSPAFADSKRKFKPTLIGYCPA